METIATIPEVRARLVAGFAEVRSMVLPATAESARAIALGVAEIVRVLDADEDVVLAALIQPLLEIEALTAEFARKTFGEEPARLARELSQLGRFGLPADWQPERGLDAIQAEALRKMLLAAIGDVRLVIVRLAEQLHKLRTVKTAPAAAQRRVALETREVYAPLANRLGVWQLKWELEDLAFRHLEPTQYKHIAVALNSRRSERERYIGDLQSRLRDELHAAGIEAAVEGRPKHIYSIWRKMKSKGLAFENVMDIRALRILVSTVAQCYGALGVVHSAWPFIAGEFDDYIATPKGNAYRSIHTAVVGPGDEPVEIQIRTHEMHAHSERGVAAHWRYKEGGRADQSYERKINQLRALLSPAQAQAQAPAEGDLLERMRLDLFQDRIYVLSPKGEIVDVPVGGTPLDFAYRLHTDLGHRTRGAKVNGRMVPLDHRLKHGDSIELVTGKTLQPSRDWLSARTGFLASSRHRNKVRAWFRKQDGVEEDEPERVPPEREIVRPDGALALPRESAPPPRAPPSRPIEVHGIGDLLSSRARCCTPLPPEAIVGYVTVGRGVSIHGQRCANFARLRLKSPERVLAVEWGAGAAGGGFPVDIEVEAFDRGGLVRDVGAALTDAKISIRAMQTRTNASEGIATMRIAIEIAGLSQLAAVLTRLRAVTSVIAARRSGTAKDSRPGRGAPRRRASG